MNPITLVVFVFGLAALVVGAEFQVRGASRLAAGVGVSPLVIGVAFVIPLTAVTLLVVALRVVRANRRENTELDGPGKRSTTR